MTSAGAEAVKENASRIRAGIHAACVRAGRESHEVRLVAVSKTMPAQAIRWARGAGVTDFGENYVKELVAKAAEVDGVTWHFVGTLQTNTARHVAQHADVVHTCVPGGALRRLASRAAERGRSIPALIEVDFTGRRTGVAPEEVLPFADQVAVLEGVRLAGLMTLPPMPERPEDTRPYFRRLRELRDVLAELHGTATELSMGMSMDYDVAVEEGATMVRIGTALFGERPPKDDRLEER